MSGSYQEEIPKARINLYLALHTGGAQKKTELPLKLLTVRGFCHGREDAHFVAVVGLFNRPDQKENRWRLVLTRDELDPDKPRTIELGDGWLSLVPVKEGRDG
ncbi:type VI secretion system contractile sheath small subunit [Citrobacter cronae]|nr:type VI secretion system contractile sheath small subunit [Citrobacter cronae]